MSNYRLYSITNMYTSGIHAGIQTAHLVHELFITKYFFDTEELDVLNQWANFDKTIIVLNGGYQSNLERIRNEYIITECFENRLPWAEFRESQEALNGALTAVGFVVPESIYTREDWYLRNLKLA